MNSTPSTSTPLEVLNGFVLATIKMADAWLANEEYQFERQDDAERSKGLLEHIRFYEGFTGYAFFLDSNGVAGMNQFKPDDWNYVTRAVHSLLVIQLKSRRPGITPSRTFFENATKRLVVSFR